MGKPPVSRSRGSGKVVDRFMPPKPTRSLAGLLILEFMVYRSKVVMVYMWFIPL